MQNITALANKNAIIVQNLYSLLYERILTKKVENYVPITLTILNLFSNSTASCVIQFSVMMYRNATIHIIIKERLKTGASFTATTTARIRSTTHRLINRRKRSRSILLIQ